MGLGLRGRSLNPPTLYLLPCVRTQTQSRTLAETFNTIYSLAARQDKGDARCLPTTRRDYGWGYLGKEVHLTIWGPCTPIKAPLLPSRQMEKEEKKFGAETLRHLRVPLVEHISQSRGFQTVERVTLN